MSPVPVGYLPQSVDLLDPSRSVLDALEHPGPTSTPGQVRARLARLHLRGHSVEQPVETLSGGERFRATLARCCSPSRHRSCCCSTSRPNNLGLASVARLGSEALTGIPRALLVVGHDETFLRRELGLTRRLELTENALAGGRPAREPPAKHTQSIVEIGSPTSIRFPEGWTGQARSPKSWCGRRDDAHPAATRWSCRSHRVIDDEVRHI